MFKRLVVLLGSLDLSAVTIINKQLLNIYEKIHTFEISVVWNENLAYHTHFKMSKLKIEKGMASSNLKLQPLRKDKFFKDVYKILVSFFHISIIWNRFERLTSSEKI